MTQGLFCSFGSIRSCGVCEGRRQSTQPVVSSYAARPRTQLPRRLVSWSRGFCETVEPHGYIKPLKPLVGDEAAAAAGPAATGTPAGATAGRTDNRRNQAHTSFACRGLREPLLLCAMMAVARKAGSKSRYVILLGGRSRVLVAKSYFRWAYLSDRNQSMFSDFAWYCSLNALLFSLMAVVTSPGAQGSNVSGESPPSLLLPLVVRSVDPV